MTDRLTALTQDNARLRERLRSAGIDPGDTPGSAPAPGEQDYTNLLLDSMSEGFYVVDSSGLTTVCNAAALRLFGFAHVNEVLGRSLHEIVHHSHADGSHYPVGQCPIYRAARQGIPARITGEVFFRRDGTPFPVDYRVEPIVKDGVVLGAICTFSDITGRIEAERQIEDGERRLALAVAAGGIGVWDYVPRTSALHWDDRVRSHFGLGPGKPITIETNIAAIHPGDRGHVECAMQEAFDPTGTGGYDVQFRTIGIEDGVERWVAARGQTIFKDGRPEWFFGVSRDISEEKQAELHLRLMVNELNHRVKNSLAMVQAVALQTLRGTTDIDTARTALTARLVALARAHDVLTTTRWEGADLRNVVALSMQPLIDHPAQRFTIDGPPVALSPKAVLAFSIALHELVTNAVKYGALSVDTGRVVVRWSDDGHGEDRRLLFTWTEKGGPAVHPPRQRGFGSKLIERGLASELQGTVRIEFPPAGVVCTIDAPYPVAQRGSWLP